MALLSALNKFTFSEDLANSYKVNIVIKQKPVK